MRTSPRSRACLACLTLCAVLSGVPTIHAQNAKKDEAAVAVWNRAIEAVGTHKKPVTTVVASGTLTYFHPGGVTTTIDMKLIADGAEHLRWEAKAPGGVTITVLQGPGGYTQTKSTKTPISAADVTGRGSERFPALALATWLTAADTQLSYVGRVTGSGTDQHQVKLSKVLPAISAAKTRQAVEESTQIDWFFDATTGLPSWLRYYENAARHGQRLPLDLVFADFKQVDGVSIPTTVCSYRNTVKISELRFDKINLNAKVSADDFK
jgi:hypothetical protein